MTYLVSFLTDELADARALLALLVARREAAYRLVNERAIVQALAFGAAAPEASAFGAARELRCRAFGRALQLVTGKSAPGS